MRDDPVGKHDRFSPPRSGKLKTAYDEEQYLRAKKAYARPPIIGGNGGTSEPLISAFNIISQASPGTVLSGLLGPLNYDSSFFGLGSRGEVLLMKFGSPFQGTPALQNLIYQFPVLAYTIATTFLTDSDSCVTSIDIFFLVDDYDTTTINWTTQPFGLTPNGGGDGSTIIESFTATALFNGTGVYNYNTSLDGLETNVPIVDGHATFAPRLGLTVTTIVNPTTFEFNGGGTDYSWLPGQIMYFTAGSIIGATPLVISSTNTTGTTWRIVTSVTGASVSDAFSVFRKLYGIGIGINCSTPITVATLAALNAAPTMLLSSN